MAVTKVTLSKLHSQIWHDELPQHLIDRATKLYPWVKDLFPNRTVEDWVSGFKYDYHPETEIAHWEKMVSIFRLKIKGKRLSAKEKEYIWSKILLQYNEENPIIISEGEIPFA